MSGAIDVLVLLSNASDFVSDSSIADDLLDARAAVAELIEAVKELLSLDELDPEDAEDAGPHVEAAVRAALARVGAA